MNTIKLVSAIAGLAFIASISLLAYGQHQALLAARADLRAQAAQYTAAAAFMGTTAVLMIYGWNRQVTLLLALIGLTLLSLFLWIAPDETAIEERSYSSVILLGMTLLVLFPGGAPA